MAFGLRGVNGMPANMCETTGDGVRHFGSDFLVITIL